jgi:hypothetical protein
MQEDKRGRNESEEQKYREMIIVPYIRDLSELKRLASKHSFRTKFKPGNKMELKARAQQPLGEKQKSVIYTRSHVSTRKQ